MSVNAILQGQSYTRIEEDALLDTKQDVLTFDTIPVASSTNPIISGAVYSGLEDKMVKGVDYVTAGQKNGTILGTKATAEGYNTISSGSYAHAEGHSTGALGSDSHAEGKGTISQYQEGLIAPVERGTTTYTLSQAAYTAADVGNIIQLGTSSVMALITGKNENNQIVTNTSLNPTMPISQNANITIGTGAGGVGSHAEGDGTIALGIASHAEGNDTTAQGSYSHAEGDGTLASESSSHAEGKDTMAQGLSSHAEGKETKATKSYSHAEGDNTTASGISSHAEGNITTASGNYSHAEGNNTIAQRKSQHVFGEYNIADTTGANGTERGDYIEIVGRGTASTPLNARTLDWHGNEVLAGKLTIGASPTENMDVANKKYVDDGLSGKQASITAGTGLTFSNTTLNHKNSVTAGTAGTSSATSGSTLAVPYITYDAQGHITAKGTHTHTITGFQPTMTAGTGLTFSSNTLNHSNSVTAGTAGSTADYEGYGFGVPYVKYDAQGHITSAGSRVITVQLPTSQITGTLGVGKGGTGLTANPSMLTNLGTTNAANVLQASPRPGITGTLGVANGGTGLTANPSMLVNLGSTSAANVFAASPRPGITGTLGVAHGGTGGTVPYDICRNIGAALMNHTNLLATSFVPPINTTGWNTSYLTAAQTSAYATIQLSDTTHNGQYYLTTGVKINTSSYRNKDFVFSIRWAVPTSSILANGIAFHFKSTRVNDDDVIQNEDGTQTLTKGSSARIWSDANATYGIRVGIALTSEYAISVSIRIDAGHNTVNNVDNILKIGATKLEVGTTTTLYDSQGNLYGNINYQPGTLAVGKGGTGVASCYKNGLLIGNATQTYLPMQALRTQSGALYSTGQDVTPTWGVLPVAQGGTGFSSVPHGALQGSTNGIISHGFYSDFRIADIDATTQPGFYGLSSSIITSGTPPQSGTFIGGLIVCGYTSTQVLQIAAVIKVGSGTGTNVNTLKIRSTIDGGSTWSAWKTVTAS